MPIECPNCKVQNRDGAKFCRVCRTPLTAPPPQVQPQPSQPWRPPSTPSQPPPPSRIIPRPPSPLQVPTGRQPQPTLPIRMPLDGKVELMDPERQERLPFDPGRTLVLFSVLALLLAGCGISVAFTLVFWIVLAVVGLGGVGCLLPMLLGPLSAVFGPLISWLKGGQVVHVLNFQVLVQDTYPVDVILYRKPGGGSVRLGDRVRVWGARQRGTGVVRACKVEVYETGGRSTSYRIAGIMPWPIWPGLFMLAGMIATVIYWLEAMP